MAQCPISLVEWHIHINQVSGSMCLRYTRATPAEVLSWARQLHKLAHEMKAAAVAAGADPALRHGPIAEDVVPDIRVELLHVTPAILAAILQPKNTRSRVWRLPVPADRELVETALNPVSVA
jgi:hypothetical protein